jgi:N6-adenosine-specific RNA methylase IME4
MFNILYADPPWGYDNKKTGGSHTSGASQKYPVMATEEIAELEVGTILTPDAVCFLWATVPMLPDALHVLSSWGFDYKTTIAWHKTGRLGTGYWFRGEVELLLFGIKGKVPAFRTALRNHISHPVLRHSEKPEVFRELIENATTSMEPRSRVELFARRTVPNWTAVGNAIDGVDIHEALAS